MKQKTDTGSGRIRLEAALRDADPLTQGEAARLLGEMGDPRSVDPLLAYVSESRHYTKTAGIEALRRIGDRRAAGALRRLAGQPNVPDDWYWYGFRSVRAAAALALLDWGDTAGAAWLEERADAGDVVLYAWYAPAILRLPDGTSEARRLKARLTPAVLCGEEGSAAPAADPARWAMIAEALEMIGGPAAGERLRRLTAHFSRYVRARAIAGLLAVDPSAPSRARAEELRDADAADYVRIRAAFALGRAGWAGAGAFLAAAAGTAADPFDRAAAIVALGELGGPAAVPAAEAALPHADPWVRQVALEALVRVRAPGARAAAERMLDDPAPRVRLQAAAGLAALEEERP